MTATLPKLFDRSAIFSALRKVLVFAVALALAGLAADRAAAQATLVPHIGHSSDVNGIAYAPSGQWLATSDYESAIKLWDANSGRLLRTLDGRSGVAISPDSRLVASAYGETNVRVFDAKTGAALWDMPGHSKTPTRFVFAPDGRFLVSASGERPRRSSGESAVRVWNITDGRLLRTLTGHTDAVRAVAVSPNGRIIVTGSWDGTVNFWDATSGQKLRTAKPTLKDQTGQTVEAVVTSLTFTPDGRSLLVAAGPWPSTARNDNQRLRERQTRAKDRIWLVDAVTAQVGRSGASHDDWVTNIAISADGQTVYTAGLDGVVRMWSFGTLQSLRTLPGERYLALSPKSDKVAVAGKLASVAMVDIPTGRREWTAGSQTARVSAASFSANGRVLATSETTSSATLVADHSTIRLRDVATGRLTRSITMQEHGFTPVTGLSPDGAAVAFSTQAGSDKIEIEVWDALQGKKKYPVSDGHHNAAFSPDGKLIATTQARYDDTNNASATINLYDAAAGGLVRTLTGAPDKMSSVVFSPDSKSLVAIGWENGMTVFDVASGQPLRAITKDQLGISSWSWQNKPSDDWSRIAAKGFFDDTVKIFDFSSGRPLIDIPDVDFFFALSPDGRFLASKTKGFHRDARIWSTATGKSTAALKGHTADITSLQFTSGSRRLVTTSDDGTIKYWDVETGALIVTMISSGADDWLAITPEGFFDASPDGAKLLSVVRGLDVFGIDRVYDALYRPDLVREKLAGDPTGKVKAAAAKLDLDKIVDSGPAPRVSLDASGTAANSNAEEATLEANITDRGGGIGRLEWRVNGVTLGLEERGLVPVAASGTITARRTLALEPGDNDVELIAYNAKNFIASVAAKVKLRWDGGGARSKPRLHVLAIGINEYFDSRMRLKWAVDDAKAIGDALKSGGAGLYENVNVVTLLDADATAPKIAAAFADLARTIRARDVFVLFLSGHGKTEDGRYYFIPQDFRYQGPESLAERAIGQDKWQTWLATIVARKSLLLYDTCEAGSLTGDTQIASRGGLEQATAIDRLTRAMGRTLLSASSDREPALEGVNGHGIFTYALLDAIYAGDRNGNNLIEVTELAGYVDQTVPDLSFKTFNFRQVPQMSLAGSDFPLIGRSATALVTAPEGRVAPISTRPTHVIVLPAPVRAGAGSGDKVGDLAPGTTVVVVRSEGGWTLVARDGREVGFVNAGSLLALQ